MWAQIITDEQVSRTDKELSVKFAYRKEGKLLPDVPFCLRKIHSTEAWRIAVINNCLPVDTTWSCNQLKYLHNVEHDLLLSPDISEFGFSMKG